MTTLVLDKPALELRCDGQALALYDNGERQGTIPLALLQRVVLLGSQIKLDSGVLARLGEAGVALLVLGRRGGQRQSLALGPRHNDAALRLAQSLAVMDEGTVTAVARALVHAKTRAQIRLLQRLQGQRPDCRKPLFDALNTLRDVLGAIPGAVNAAALRGLEGGAAAAYFRALPAVFPPALGFTGRNRRPPRDPVNAMLSLGYTLLHAEAVRAAHIAGLDPLLGFYHRPAFGRDSLACDLIEPLRPRLDEWVWELVRARQLREQHFATSASGCQLQKAGRARFYEAYENAALPWRRWLRRQCSALVMRLRARAPALEVVDYDDLP